METKIANLNLQAGVSDSTPTVDLVNSIINSAIELGASDIHLDPQAGFLRVRFRIDGLLRDVNKLSSSRLAEIIGRIKILSGLPTDEHRRAQDGRFKFVFKDGSVDVRVSIAPTYYGENAVLRLLSRSLEQDLGLEGLGFSPLNLERVIKALRLPHGLILVTGPTGAGKTTTLYSLIEALNTSEVSIVTVEDPIEYAISGIEQIQVSAKGELNFANGLRSILRQDPNIIMVGEIRDPETASLAVNASLTGHLLLSTLHTNDAAASLPRLLDMKIESYLIASTVRLVIAQRLLRKICEACKQRKNLNVTELKSISVFLKIEIEESQGFYFGAGCNDCQGSGFKGRIGVHEVLEINKPIREAVLRKDQADLIKDLAVGSGMVSLTEDALQKARAGITTIEEVLRISSPE